MDNNVSSTFSQKKILFTLSNFSRFVDASRIIFTIFEMLILIFVNTKENSTINQG